MAISFYSTIYLCASFTLVLQTSSFQGETQEEVELSNIDILLEEARNLPIEDFIDDPELTQHVDYINKITQYKKIERASPSNEPAAVIYQRKAIDKGNMVVVLTSAEDEINVFIRKRTFVVLRQNPMTSRTYFATYAYIRYSADANCAEWDGELRCIEWDTWDNSRGIVKAKSKYFGWTNCASSFLASCTFNESHSEDSRDRMQPSTQKENVENGNSKSPTAFLPCPGYEEDDSVDVFADLDVNVAEAQYIGKAVRHSAIQGAKALLEKSSKGSSGRSLSRMESDSDLHSAMKKAKLQALKKRKEKQLLKAKLLERDRLLRQHSNVNFQLNEIAKKNRLGSWWKIQTDAKLMEKFTKINTTTDLLEKLKDTDMQLQNVSLKTEKDFELIGNKNKEPVILQGANEEPDVGELAESIGSTLTQTAGKTPAGRSISSDAADIMGKSVAKGLLSTTTDIFSHPGWKMQSVHDFVENISLRYENMTFVGFGGCHFSEVSPENLYDELDLETIVNLYLQFLKTSCTQEVIEYVKYLLSNGYLKREGNFLEVPPDLKQFKKQKLNATELQQLSSAFELSIFTKTFLSETKLWIYDPVAPNGDQVSRSIHFIVKLGLNVIQEARQKTPLHFIKLCRNFVLTLKMIFTKLLQDYEILQTNCPTCSSDFVINANDRNYIYGLMEFIIRALRPVEIGENPHRIFLNFYATNHQAVKYKADLYL